MSTITKEWLRSQISAIKTVGITDSNTLKAFEIALASLEAEPVAWLLSGGGAKNHVSFDSGNAYADPLREVTPLYTAPPAPVSVPDEWTIADAVRFCKETGRQEAGAAMDAWNACRAAMLQGADPVQAWIPCSERMPDTMISVLVTGDWFRHAVSFWDGASWCDLDFEPPVTHWQPLPAAPQQEVTQALAKGMERYGDAMQKLADSDD